jgi:ketol-acid reductoisomerase
MPGQDLDFGTTVVDKEYITLAARREAIVRGGRQLSERLPGAFAGVGQIGVIGWEPQGSAQARTFFTSVKNSGCELSMAVIEIDHGFWIESLPGRRWHL